MIEFKLNDQVIVSNGIDQRPGRVVAILNPTHMSDHRLIVTHTAFGDSKEDISQAFRMDGTRTHGVLHVEHVPMYRYLRIMRELNSIGAYGWSQRYPSSPCSDTVLRGRLVNGKIQDIEIYDYKGDK